MLQSKFCPAPNSDYKDFRYETNEKWIDDSNEQCDCEALFKVGKNLLDEVAPKYLSVRLKLYTPMILEAQGQMPQIFLVNEIRAA